MIRRIINNKTKTITAAAVILGAASLVSRLIGLVRDRFLAGRFGAGDELDIYYAAFRLPDLVYSLLVMGAISAGFIPVFIDYLKKNKTQAWHLANSVLNILTICLISIAIILIICAPLLVKLVAPGFDADKMALTVLLTRIMFLSPIFFGLSAVLGGILQSHRRFLMYSLGPVMYNIGIIFGVVYLVDWLGLIGLAIGVVIGSFLHLAIQIPTALICGYRYRPVFDFRFSGVKRILKMIPPRVMSLALAQANLWVLTIIASLLAIGSITIFNFALNIWSFPLGVFGLSFVLAAFPNLASAAKDNNQEKFADIFSKTAIKILFFIIPATFLFITLSRQIVYLILGTGQFGRGDLSVTAATLIFFALSLSAEALIYLFLRGFFAHEDTWTPLIVGLFATGVRVGAAWYLSRQMGVAGLALGYSVGSIIYLVFLWAGLHIKTGALKGKEIIIAASKIMSACIIASAIVFAAASYLGIGFETGGFSVTLIKTGIMTILFSIIYLGLGYALKLREVNYLMRSVKKIF